MFYSWMTFSWLEMSTLTLRYTIQLSRSHQNDNIEDNVLCCQSRNSLLEMIFDSFPSYTTSHREQLCREYNFRQLQCCSVVVLNNMPILVLSRVIRKRPLSLNISAHRLNTLTADITTHLTW